MTWSFGSILIRMKASSDASCCAISWWSSRARASLDRRAIVLFRLWCGVQATGRTAAWDVASPTGRSRIVVDPVVEHPVAQARVGVPLREGEHVRIEIAGAPGSFSGVRVERDSVAEASRSRTARPTVVASRPAVGRAGPAASAVHAREARLDRLAAPHRPAPGHGRHELAVAERHGRAGSGAGVVAGDSSSSPASASAASPASWAPCQSSTSAPWGEIVCSSRSLRTRAL